MKNRFRNILMATAFIILIPKIGLADHPHTFGWVYTNGSPGGYAFPRNVGTDAEGNAYQIGSFTGTIDFDPGPGVDSLTAPNPYSVFLVKLSSNGTYQWVRQIPGGDEPSIAVAPNGDQIIVSDFYGTADLDPTSGVDLHNSQNATHAFIIKLRADGSFAWAHSFGGTYGVTYSEAATVNSLGNVYVAGESVNISDPIDFDPGPGVDLHSGNVFVTKYSSEGNYLGTQTWNLEVPFATDVLSPYALTTDSQSNLYIAGGFSGQGDFDPSENTDIRTSNGFRDAFITKINVDGSYGWTFTYGGPDIDKVMAVRTDSNDQVIAGGFTYTPGGTNVMSRPRIWKLNSNGQLQWMRSTGVIITTGGPSSVRVATDSSNNIYAFGSFQGTVDFDPEGNHETFTDVGGRDLFLTKVTGNNIYRRTQIITGSGIEGAANLSVDLHNHIVMGGAFSGTVDFDPGAGTQNRSAIGTPYDFFILKLNRNRFPNGTPVPVSNSVQITPGDVLPCRPPNCTP